MNPHTLRTLEFEPIRRLVLSHAGSADGRSRIEALEPWREPSAVRDALAVTGEAVALLRAPGRQPYHDLPDLGAILPSAQVAGLHLEPLALSDVASFIEGAGEVALRVARAEGAPRLSRLASGVADVSDVATAIRRAILPGGEVSDDASPRLAEVRRSLRARKARLQSVMESFLHGKDADRVLQDKLITTRNDRYVLLLKAEHRGQVPGIVHGSSGSGASLFVEPMPAVELNNDIVALADEEREEVVRILESLTRRVGDRADDLAHAVDVMGELDAAQARALTAKDMDAVAPQIVEDARLDLRDARHPLLMPHLAERLGMARRTSGEPVPVSLKVGGSEPVLVISGPNTGGKTVALKTVGLLSLMAQCGLHVPAAEGSTLPVLRSLYADIGDEQSIAANLSTFSAHLTAIVEMTRDVARPALVLLDEVGAGTDPTEGGALGVAIVDHFRRQGAMVVATTHHGLMKAYAQSTPGVACASFGYDPNTYQPTYRLALGVPGRSLALEMAERLGLPAPVVQDARSRLDVKEAQAEALLKKLEADQALLRHEQALLAAERRELEEEQKRQADVEQALAARRRSEVESFRKELARRSEQMARQAADGIREAVQRLEDSRKPSTAAAGRARTQAVQAVREAEAEAVAGLQAPVEAEAPGVEIAVGTRARVRSLGIVGEVLGVAGNEVELAVSGKRLRVPREELVPLQGPVTRASNVSVSTASKGGGGGVSEVTPRHAAERPSRAEIDARSASINLVGLTVDEALPRVDKLLDDAVIAERKQVRVIHGFGAGRLRQAVAGLLKGHPHVAAYHVGAEGRGGVTVVDLKE
jgi:DNA mismatch repair protein MutS2